MSSIRVRIPTWLMPGAALMRTNSPPWLMPVAFLGSGLVLGARRCETCTWGSGAGKPLRLFWGWVVAPLFMVSLLRHASDFFPPPLGPRVRPPPGPTAP